MYQLFLSFSCVQKTESCPGIEQEKEGVGGRLLYVFVTDRLQLTMQMHSGAGSNALAKIGRRRKSARMRGHRSRNIAETKSESWAKDGLLVKEEQESCVIGTWFRNFCWAKTESQDGQRIERPTQSLLVGAVNCGLRGESQRLRPAIVPSRTSPKSYVMPREPRPYELPNALCNDMLPAGNYGKRLGVENARDLP